MYRAEFPSAVFGYLIASWPGYKLNREAHIDEVALDRDAGLLEIKRYSLKGRERVQHPLSDLSYADLDIGNGGAAVAAFAKLASGDATDEEIQTVRGALLEYCKLDTLAMTRVLGTLSTSS